MSGRLNSVLASFPLGRSRPNYFCDSRGGPQQQAGSYEEGGFFEVDDGDGGGGPMEEGGLFEVDDGDVNCVMQ